jgi:hypothetical protein
MFYLLNLVAAFILIKQSINNKVSVNTMNREVN